MKKPEDAADLHFKKGMQDYAAATVLAADSSIADEVIGFHLQQAYEKGLKSILAKNAIHFRKSHDLRELMDLLEANGIGLPPQYSTIDEWTPYGVEMRYDDVPVNIPVFDRNRELLKISKFFEWVKNTLTLC